jgi:uncharacterized protein (DUF934 family)
MLLLRDGVVIDDPWVAVADGEPLPEAKPLLVSLARFQAERAALVARAVPLGVKVPNTADVATLAPDFGSIKLVALVFPKFNDGRAFSQARLLRERYGFAGEVRATGAVLRDQLLFMQRCGFDAFEIVNPDAVGAWRAALAEFQVFFQPTGDGRVTAPLLRRAAAGR